MKNLKQERYFYIFLKTFDKVEHKGRICKLCKYGFSCDLLSLLIDVLTNKKQRVALNGQNSSWADIKVNYFWLMFHFIGILD